MKHTHCLGPIRASMRPEAPRSTSYARLFPDLPPFTAGESFLFALGRAGGLCDCGSGSDDAGSLGSEAAGWPFVGQFVAHDITADRSALRAHVDPSRLRNARSPQLNLECLYGDGPVGHPFLYCRDDPAKLLTGADGCDVLRNPEGIAIIGDPRNDSHLFMSQMHLAFVHAHNALVDRVRDAGTSEDEVFETAARELRWTYQSSVLKEFLPRLTGPTLLNTILEHGRRYYCPRGEPFIPLEFADAAYRYGHSQIRHQYRVNLEVEPVPLFPELIGFRPVSREYRVDWTLLFDVDGYPAAQRAKKIDGRLARLRIAAGHVRLPSPTAPWQSLPTLITLTGLRGYQEAYKRLVPVIESRPGLTPCPEGSRDVMLGRLASRCLTTPRCPSWISLRQFAPTSALGRFIWRCSTSWRSTSRVCAPNSTPNFFTTSASPFDGRGHSWARSRTGGTRGSPDLHVQADDPHRRTWRLGSPTP